jgi:hypothetical protein
MIEHWPWYVSGIALASIPIVHWLGLDRALAVSGRFSALVNRARLGSEAPRFEMSPEQLVAAMREATIAAFGSDSVTAVTSTGTLPEAPTRLPLANHLLFLSGMLAGGLLSALLAGSWSPAFELQGETFNGLFGRSPAITATVLIGGGVLVGFGTRMAAGCTTGHGLCGVSRFQKASLAATGAFFGAAVVVSMIFKVLS